MSGTLAAPACRNSNLSWLWVPAFAGTTSNLWTQLRMNAAFLIQLLVNGLVVGTLYGVVAMSFVLIYKATQVVNFAQGELL